MFSVVPKVVQLAVYLKFRRRFDGYEVLFCKILVFAIVVPSVDMPQERQSLVTRPPVIMFAYMQYIHVSYLCVVINISKTTNFALKQHFCICTLELQECLTGQGNRRESCPNCVLSSIPRRSFLLQPKQ